MASLSYPDFVNFFNSQEINITWSLINILYFGSKEAYIPKTISLSDLCCFAEMFLLRTKDINVISYLSEILYNDSEQEISEVLDKLSSTDSPNTELDNRKARLYFVWTCLKKINLEMDYTEGLLELTEIWVTLNFPANSPHIIQGRFNEITPKNYYTSKNFKILLIKHHDWIREEAKQIISLEKQD